MNILTIAWFTAFLAGFYFGLGAWLRPSGPDADAGWHFFFRSTLGLAISAICATLGYFAGLTLNEVFWILILVSGGGWIRLLCTGCPQTVFRSCLASAAIWILVLTILLLPSAVGGVQFALFQGNHHDTYNYIEAAATYALLPKSTVTSLPVMEVVNLGAFVSGPWDLNFRPAVSILYGCVQFAAHESFVGLHYVFLAYGLFLAAGVLALGAGYLLPNLPGWSAAAIGLAFAGGFWGQYTLDINAWSQTIWIPIQLLGILLLLPQKTPPTDLRSDTILGTLKQLIPLALCVIGSFYLYPEGVLFFAPALIYSGIVYIQTVTTRRGLIHASLVIALMVAFAAPVWSCNVKFILGQIKFAQTPVDWWKFFQAPLFGLDGVNSSWWPDAIDGLGGVIGAYFLTPSAGVSSSAQMAWRVVLCAWFVGLLYGLIRYNNRRLPAPRPDRVLLLVVVLLGGQCVWLWYRGQYWGAGKGLSLASPLIILLLTLPGFVRKTGPSRVAKAFTVAPSILLIVSQLGFSIYRISAAAEPSGIHYRTPYPAIQNELLKTTFNFGDDHFVHQLTPSDEVAVRIDNPWTESFVQMELLAHRIPFHLELPVRENRYSEKRIGTASARRPPTARLSVSIMPNRSFPSAITVERLAGTTSIK